MGPIHPGLEARTRALSPVLAPGLVRVVLGLLLVAVLLAWQLAMAAPAQAKAGDLDPSFGTGGKVTTDFGTIDDSISDKMAVQADGKPVAAGYADDGPARDFALARYTPSGTLDPTFGSGGMVTTDFYGFTDHAQAGLVVQPDGKLVAAGASFTLFTGGNYDFALARYNPDGTLDASFGSGGKVTTDLLGFDDQAFALARQPDGKLVAAGEAGADFALARYNPDGTLDPSFNGSGLVTTDFAGAFDRVEALAVQADGKLVAAGQAFSGASLDFALARYNPDGTLDASFGSGGKVTTDLAGGDDAGFFTIAILAGGKLMAQGSGFTGAGQDFTLARYNPNGTLDPSFGSGGKVTTDFAGGDDIGIGLVVQADGKLVAGGYAFIGAVRDFAPARYKPNGTLDRAFGRQGKLTTDFTGGGDDGAVTLAMQADGKLVAGGFAAGPGGYDFALARYRA
jgi:uncharacterized delta-60 repeat protein